jgi:hypothetical protein
MQDVWTMSIKEYSLWASAIGFIIVIAILLVWIVIKWRERHSETIDYGAQTTNGPRPVRFNTANKLNLPVADQTGRSRSPVMRVGYGNS